MTSKLLCLAAAGLLYLTTTAGVHAETEISASDSKAPAHEQSATANGDQKGNEMPDPEDYSGLSRKVLQYSEAFNEIVGKIKEPGFSDADWAPLEALVDVDNFERMGVFLTDQAEVIDWEQYKKYISQYGGATSWAGTLRRITEVPGLVILELEERNTRNGVTDVSNTVTIYEFNDAGKLRHLDVYVMPLP